MRVLFWRPNAGSSNDGVTFAGPQKDRQFLEERDVRFSIRWNRVPEDYAHHKKCWMIDAGYPTEVAFVEASM